MLEIESKLNKINLGNCLEGMKKLPSNSIDLVVTDPPYALTGKSRGGPGSVRICRSDTPFGRTGLTKPKGGFMGKSWDSEVPSVEIWAEMLRVVKPGGFAFIMMTPRQDSLAQTIVRLGEAGWETGLSSLYHCYATGFPKCGSISKLVDRKLGAEREVVGKGKSGKPESHNSYNMANHDSFGGEFDITAPATPEAKALDGAYTPSLKPALEIILVVMRPLDEKSYTDQALANRGGVFWMDDCRIPYQSNDDFSRTEMGFKAKHFKNLNEGWQRPWQDELKNEKSLSASDSEGRFPANLLVSDNVLDIGANKKSSGGGKHVNKCRQDLGYGFSGEPYGDTVGMGDSGDLSRYFSLDAWFSERLKLLEKFELKESIIEQEGSPNQFEMGEFCNECDKRKDYKCGCNVGFYSKPKGVQKTKNTHPTTKSIKLMSWLIMLASRQDDIILDPFAGSGTTLIAAKILNRQYIGFELEPEYHKIAEARLSVSAREIVKMLGNQTIKEEHSGVRMRTEDCEDGY